jgi:hypothetical protein
MKISRHINHTGRRKIKQSEVQISLNEHQGDAPSFDASFTLDSSKLPGDAALYVEAYHKNTSQRFHFGTAGSPIPPENRTLDQLDLSGPILFRVKIVDNSDRIGRLVASAERLRPKEDEEEDSRASLMTFKSTDLGDLTWKMSFSPGSSKPVLCINSHIPEAKGQLMNNPVFQGLVLPAALRETLMFIFLNIAEEDPDEDSWHKPWLDFASFIAPEDKPESADPFELNDWVDGVVTEFSRRHELCDLLVTRMEDTGQ